MVAMKESHDDDIAVTVSEDVRIPNISAVELPLAVKPTDAGIEGALALIGGMEELSKVTADEERPLKLHARPKDPLCRPLVARRNAPDRGSGFVFKVKRRRLRPRRDLDGDVEDTRWSIASVEAIGSVHTNFQFHSLADAQFVSCRPKDVGVEDSIEEHIEAAAARSEPMELVPPSFLPSYTKVSRQSREEKMLRRKKKDNAHVRIERGGLLVYHRFGEAVKLRTKNGVKLMKDSRAVEHLRDHLEKKWGAGRLRGRRNRPSRVRIGISGHNEVREQQLLLVQKIEKLFEKQPMYFMRQIEYLLRDQPAWPIRDLVPAVAYYYCNGPWRGRWVRFGYRPEDHPMDRYDQLLEFKVSQTQLRIWTEALDKISPPKNPATAAIPGRASSASASTASSTGAPHAVSARCSATPVVPAASSSGSGSGSGNGGTPGAGEIIWEGGANAKRAIGPDESGSSTTMNSCKSSSDDNHLRNNNNHHHHDNNDNNDPEGDLPSNTAGVSTPAEEAPIAGDDNDVVEDTSVEEEGVQVAEAEREEEEEEEDPLASIAGAVSSGGGGGGGAGEGREPTPGKMSSPGLAVGGVVPDAWLTSKTKGRFASQVVVNGGMLLSRNRVLVKESPFRSVQELALKAPRLDRPGIVTGWWQQSTIEAFRLLTLEGISAIIKIKKQENAAATAADKEKSTLPGKRPSSNSAASAAAVAPRRKSLPANMTRVEFDKAAKVMETMVEVVKAPAVGAGGSGDEEWEVGAPMGQVRIKSTKMFTSTGRRSGTGRVAGGGGGGGGAAAKRVAAGKRPAPGDDSSGIGSGGGDGDGDGGNASDVLRDADRAVLRSGDDSEETETDSVNSSRLVDDTDDSWDSQQDSDDEGKEDSSGDEEEDEEGGEGEGEEAVAVAERGAGVKCPHSQPSKAGGRGRAATRGRR